VFAEAPENALGNVMTPNVVACLQNQLKADSRYLQRSAQKAIQAMHARLAKTPTVALVVLRGILADAGALQFDVVTKTKTIEKLVTASDDGSICDFLGELFQKPGVGNSNEITHARKTITDLLANTCMHSLSADQSLQESVSDTDAVERSPLVQSRHVMEILVQIAFFVQPAVQEVAPASRQYVRERIMACLEQALKTKAIGRALLHHTVASVTRFQNHGRRPAFDFDDSIKAIMKGARRRLDIFEKKGFLGNGVHGTDGNGAIDGIILLYHLALLQVYSGEPEAVTIVEDLNEYHDKLTGEDNSFMGSDVLVEVLLTFASKPSKFLRKISLQAFGSFAAQISQEGLQSLIRVLETKENLQGQGEMFDAEEPEDDAVNGINGSDSDIEVDSDVEEISDQGGRSSDESSEADVDGEDRESAEDEDNDQLAAFDAMLAAALGTRKGEDDLAASDTSGSDDDMSDSEMEALDEKLTEVFRARKDLAKPKKKEHKDAKENIVSFKNKVLDLIDVYLKQEYANPLSLQLILPLLSLARRTNVKQLADRACSILRDFNGRCRGAKLPQLADPEAALDILRAVHEEAGRPGSNAHATACSSASILLVRVLSNAKVRAGVLTHLYADTMAKMLEDKDCHVQPAFFTDWNNWCANARKAITKEG
jgi:DNA polymerase phi